MTSRFSPILYFIAFTCLAMTCTSCIVHVRTALQSIFSEPYPSNLSVYGLHACPLPSVPFPMIFSMGVYIRDQPALNLRLYKRFPSLSGFLRTYSARIYFIVSNLSLACLHMPHPSYPVDDNRTRPFDREHGLAFVQVSRTFGFSRAQLLAVVRRINQRAECSSDGYSKLSSF